MILDVVGDVFTIAAALPTPAVAHGVNTCGVMGAGFAASVRRHWPDMFTDYKNACSSGRLQPGGLHTWRTAGGGYVFNLASQDNPGANATLEWIRSSVTELDSYTHANNIGAVAMVRIGCGIGGLSWPDVAPVINAATPNLAVLVATPDPKSHTPRRR